MKTRCGFLLAIGACLGVFSCAGVSSSKAIPSPTALNATSSSMSLGGEAPTNLKVGYLDISNLYLTDSDQGSTTNEITIDVMGGYGYNVLTALSSYTNWTYTFVGGSWQKQFDSLADGSIDLLLPTAYTEDRAASFYFAKDVGIYDDLTALYTLSSSKGLYFNDLESVKSIKNFGVIRGCYDTTSFMSFAEKNSLDVIRKIKYFDNLETMQNALRKGEVDAIVSGNLYSQDFQMIYSISSYPCYIAAHDESIALKADTALQKLNADKPDFFSKTYSSFFKHLTSRKAYTAEESLFMDSMKGKSLTIVGNNSFAPFESYDESASKYVGVYPDVLDLVGKETGLSFTYKKTDSLLSSWETVKNGGSNLISGVYVDGAVTRDYNVLPTTSFYSYQNSLIVKSDFSLSTSSTLHVAIKAGFLGSISYLKSFFPKWTLTQYPSEAECIDALAKGEVDSSLISNVALNKQKLLNGHADLSALQGFSISIPLCFGVYSGNDTSTVLQGLISKAIDNIPSESISECFVKNAVGSGEPLTPQELFMSNLPLYISLIAVGAILLIALAAFLAFFITERRNRNKLTAKNEELQRALQLAESYEKSHEEADRLLESAQCGIIQISCSLDLKDIENMHLVFTNDYAIPLTGFDLRANSGFLSFYKSIANPFCKGLFDLVQKARSLQVGASVEGSFLAYDEKKTLDALAKVIAVFPKANEKIIQVTLFDVSERSEIEKKLLILSEADSLTGLLNKKTVEEHEASYLASFDGKPCALFLMDIDKFKSINDVYGHLSGDSVLLFVASFLKDIFPPDSLIGRIGGDEFSILVKDASDKAKIRRMAKAVAENGKLFKLPFTCSVGVMIFSEAQADFTACYEKVDHLLYDSKSMRDGNIAIK